MTQALFRVAAVACLTAPVFAAQFPVRGEVSVPGGAGLLFVRLSSLAGGGPSQEVEVSPSGRFEFPAVDEGEYRVQVTNSRGVVLATGLASASAGSPAVIIRIDTAKRGPSPPSGSVSARALERRTPRAAVKEAERAEDDLRHARQDSSVKHLQNAIAIDPGYAEAHSNLGVIYFRERKYADAIGEFKTASVLDPGDAAYASNLAGALCAAGDFAGAERAARQALELDPGRTAARLVLGVSLKAVGRAGEALKYLLQAAADLPVARLYAAELLEQAGRKQEAAGELKQYLAGGPEVPNRAAIEHWLSELQ